MASITQSEVAGRLASVAGELESLRASLEFPVAAHLPITAGVLERLNNARAEIEAVGAAEIADDVSEISDTQFEVEPGDIVDAGAHQAALDDGTLVPLTEPEVMPGVTMAQRDALVAAGFVTTEDIRNATDEQLLAVKDIGKVTVDKIREATKE